jgi:hypothetical protein
MLLPKTSCKITISGVKGKTITGGVLNEKSGLDYSMCSPIISVRRVLIP